MAGTTDVDAVLESMDAGEFAEWCEYDAEEPIGMQGVCIILSRIGAAIASIGEFKREGGVSCDETDFMPWFTKPKQPTRVSTGDEIVSNFGNLINRG